MLLPDGGDHHDHGDHGHGLGDHRDNGHGHGDHSDNGNTHYHDEHEDDHCAVHLPDRRQTRLMVQVSVVQLLEQCQQYQHSTCLPAPVKISFGKIQIQYKIKGTCFNLKSSASLFLLISIAAAVALPAIKSEVGIVGIVGIISMFYHLDLQQCLEKLCTSSSTKSLAISGKASMSITSAAIL